jgi:hypothetical protein
MRWPSGHTATANGQRQKVRVHVVPVRMHTAHCVLKHQITFSLSSPGVAAVNSV